MKSYYLLITLCLSSAIGYCQLPFSSEAIIKALPVDQLSQLLSKQLAKATRRMDSTIDHCLTRWQRMENKVVRKLEKMDSLVAQRYKTSIEAQYQHILQKAHEVIKSTDRPSGQYVPWADTIKSAVSYLQQQRNIIPDAQLEALNGAEEQIHRYRGKMEQAEMVKHFGAQRREQLKALIDQHSSLHKLGKSLLRKYDQQLYDYKERLIAYRQSLLNPDKWIRKALSKLGTLPSFQSLMASNSELSSLFRLPASYSTASLVGLQTRSQIQQVMQTQFASNTMGSAQIFQQSFQAAQQQLRQLKELLHKTGGTATDADLPNFKPNHQRTKSFWKRLEYGTNLQTQKSTNFWPSTSDVGLSVGYKLSDRHVIGVGGSYKVGWGKSIRSMEVTSQGASIRSYVDMHLKKSLFISGGYEQNFQPVTYTSTLTAQEQQQVASWQASGLLGLSKIISLKSKTFRKYKAQLLWDFLSYQQIPRTSAIKFRVGYLLK